MVRSYIVQTKLFTYTVRLDTLSFSLLNAFTQAESKSRFRK